MKPSYLIDPGTRLGPVHYITADLDKQLDFYTHSLGLRLHWKTEQGAGLGAGQEDLLILTEVPSAKRTLRTTGMYHFALLLPSRKELARVIARLYQRQIQNYPTDHVISKTTYVDDPEGNTIELYSYSLEDGSFSYQEGTFSAQWADGRPSSGREPLDLKTLFEELSAGDDITDPLPETTNLGHVHLFGNDLKKQMVFYRDVLGFKEGGMGERIGMAEVALDRPHVIAFNTWQGEAAHPPPEDSLGLRYFSIILPDLTSYQEVLARVQENGSPIEQDAEGVFTYDPAGIKIHLEAAKDPV